MIRCFDIIFSSLAIVILFPFLVIIFFLCYIDTGSPIFKQARAGKNGELFFIYKFRSMYIDTVSLQTHLIKESSITKIGHFLRKYKLDELPQFFNVLFNDMSIVGHRPSLINDMTLIAERKKHGVLAYKPGITGLSQLSKLDMSNPLKLALKDAEMYPLSVNGYLKISLRTLLLIVCTVFNRDCFFKSS